MGTADGDEYDALDEALMETFPASDPIAVSEPIARSHAAKREPVSATTGSAPPRQP